MLLWKRWYAPCFRKHKWTFGKISNCLPWRETASWISGVSYEFKMCPGDPKLKVHNWYTGGSKWLNSWPCISTKGVRVLMGPIAFMRVMAKWISALTGNQTPVRNRTKYFIISFIQTHSTIFLRDNNNLQQTNHMWAIILNSPLSQYVMFCRPLKRILNCLSFNRIKFNNITYSKEWLKENNKFTILRGTY